jgi:hypothetical protein
LTHSTALTATGNAKQTTTNTTNSLPAIAGGPRFCALIFWERLMKILFARPTKERGQRPCVAFVDVELNEHVRLYGLRLVRQPDGAHLIYAPQAGHRHSASFSKPMAEELTALAVAAYEATR